MRFSLSAPILFASLSLFVLPAKGQIKDSSRHQMEIYEYTDENPEYVGGNAALSKDISEKIVYPKKALEDGVSGKVYVRFIVDSLGRTSNIKVVKGVRGDLDSEAIRVVQMLGPWKPGSQMGKRVNVMLTLPIYFVIDEGNEKGNRKRNKDK